MKTATPAEPKDLRIPRLKFPFSSGGKTCGECRFFTLQPCGATCLLLGYGRAFESDPATHCGEFKAR
jgi:hypothetical protein